MSEQVQPATAAAPITETDPETEFEELDVDAPRVGIIMGSKSDMEEMDKAGKVLEERGIHYEVRVMSAHRDPDTVADYCKNARMRGLRVIIAGAGLPAALPGGAGGDHRPPLLRRPPATRPRRRRGRPAGRRGGRAGRRGRGPVDRADAAGRPGRVRRARQRAQRGAPRRAH